MKKKIQLLVLYYCFYILISIENFEYVIFIFGKDYVIDIIYFNHKLIYKLINGSKVTRVMFLMFVVMSTILLSVQNHFTYTK